YVTGFTCSLNFPVKNAFQPVTNAQNCADGGGDTFVTRVNAAGTAPRPESIGFLILRSKYSHCSQWFPPPCIWQQRPAHSFESANGLDESLSHTAVFGSS